MKRPFLAPFSALAAGLLLVGPAASVAAAPPRPDRLPGGAPPRPLLDLEPRSGWGAGVSLHWDRREFRVRGEEDGEPLEIGLRGALAHFSRPVASFALVRFDAGWARPDIAGERGDGGLWLGAALEANLGEIPLKESPVLGRVETLGLGATAGARRLDADRPDGDLDWRRSSLAVFVRYERSRRGDIATGTRLEPTGVAVRGGVEGSRETARAGGASLRERRDLGLHLGADLRWSSEWTTGLRATFFSEKDRFLGLSLSHYF